MESMEVIEVIEIGNGMAISTGKKSKSNVLNSIFKSFFLTETKRRENKKPTEAVSSDGMGHLPSQPMAQFRF